MSIREEFKQIEVSHKKMREFGVMVGGIFVILGGIFLWRGKHLQLADIFLYFGSFLFCAGLISPMFLSWLYKLWMGLAVVLGFFMSRVILSLLFYLAVTPIGILTKLMGKDFMGKKLDPQATSYWKLRDDDSQKKEFCENQY